MTIRISPRTNAALNIVVNKLKAEKKRRVRQDDAIWELIERAEPEAAAMVKDAEKGEDDQS